jgi:hypothetical protein
MFSVILPNVVTLRFIVLDFIMLNNILPSVVMLSFIMLDFKMLSVFLLSVIMVSVIMPKWHFALQVFIEWHYAVSLLSVIMICLCSVSSCLNVVLLSVIMP